MKVYILEGLTRDDFEFVIIGVHQTKEGAEKKKTEQERLNKESGEYHRFNIQGYEVEP